MEATAVRGGAPGSRLCLHLPRFPPLTYRGADGSRRKRRELLDQVSGTRHTGRDASAEREGDVEQHEQSWVHCTKVKCTTLVNALVEVPSPGSFRVRWSHVT